MSERKAAGRAPPPAEPTPQHQNEPQQPAEDWKDPGTWSASIKFLPIYIALVAIFIAIYYNNFTTGNANYLDLSDYDSCVANYNYTFHINAASNQAQELSESPQEIAWAYEATQQIYNPRRSVWSDDAFPKGKVPSLGARLDEASIYFDRKMRTTRRKFLREEEVRPFGFGASAIGVALVQFGQKWSAWSFAEAAGKYAEGLMKMAKPEKDTVTLEEFEARTIGEFAPFLAYYGVYKDDLEMVNEAVEQVRKYREHLAITKGKAKGLWRRVVGDVGHIDEGAWSTGNAVAAYGMAKLRATISAWPKSNSTMSKEIDDLDFWVQELLDAVIETDNDPSGLLRNYLGDSSWEGETSGTSLLAATAYRMAMLRPEVFAQDKYLDWAERKRHAVFHRVNSLGLVEPAAIPHNPQSKAFSDGSAEGESFVILLGAAWRDVVCSSSNDKVLQAYFENTESELAQPITFESVVGHSLEDIMKAYRQHLRRFYGMLGRRIKITFERATGYSVDKLYAQAMGPVKRWTKYLSAPS